MTPASLPKAETFTALRNLLYAIEWWVFGGFAVYIWWRWCRDELEAERDRRPSTARPARHGYVEPVKPPCTATA